MSETKKISFVVAKQVTTEKEYFIENGVYYFVSLNEDGEKYLYKRIEIVKDTRFKNLFNIEIQTVKNYGDDLLISKRKVTECDLPWSENQFFREDDSSILKSDEETFFNAKEEVLKLLTNTN